MLVIQKFDKEDAIMWRRRLLKTKQNDNIKAGHWVEESCFYHMCVGIVFDQSSSSPLPSLMVLPSINIGDKIELYEPKCSLPDDFKSILSIRVSPWTKPSTINSNIISTLQFTLLSS